MVKELLSLILIFQVLRDCVTDSEPPPTRSPFTVTAEVGQTVELARHHSFNVGLVSSYVWYRQRVGEAPMLIDISPCQGADCKFISKNGNNENVLILEIRNVQVNDSGSYYCAHWGSNSPPQNGPTLLVGDISTNKTAVLVFVPPGKLYLREIVPLVCLVSGVSSSQIVIFWNISGLVTVGPSDSGVMEADGAYSIISHAIVSRETWRSGGHCTCIVQLGSPDKYLTKSVSFPKTAEAVTGWCILALPVLITVLVILVLLLVLISIWIRKSGRSEVRDERSHNENFRLRDRMQRERSNGRQADDHRRTEAKRTDHGAIEGGPLYASLELAALGKKRVKKKTGRS